MTATIRFRGLLLATLLALSTLLVAPPPAHAASLAMTKGAYNAGVSASKWATDSSRIGSCDLHWREAFALTFAISVHEVANGDMSKRVSPMTLSRYDSWYSTKIDNKSLYSDRQYDYFKRAHWNPGVGMFQLDTWDVVKHRHHAHRMNVSTAGRHVAHYLATLRCNGATRNAAMQSEWYACRSAENKGKGDGWQCQRTFDAIFNGTSNNPSVSLNSQTQWDGGVLSRSCRWGTSDSTFGCYDIDEDRSEGWMLDGDPNGEQSMTPLANGFLNFHAGSKRYTTFLKSGTGYSSEKIQYGSTSTWRPPDNWYSNTSLQWYNSGSWTGY